jgi:hypothetical protein
VVHAPGLLVVARVELVQVVEQHPPMLVGCR